MMFLIGTGIAGFGMIYFAFVGNTDFVIMNGFVMIAGILFFKSFYESK